MLNRSKSAEPATKQAETDVEQSTPVADKTESDKNPTMPQQRYRTTQQSEPTEAERYDKGPRKITVDVSVSG